MKRLILLFLCLLLLLCGCTNQPFRIGGIDLRKTMPTLLLYANFTEAGCELSLRFYKAQPEDSVEDSLSATAPTLKAAIEDIEGFSAKEIFFMRYAVLVLGGNVDVAVSQLSFLKGKTMYVFYSAEDVCTGEVENSAEVFYFKSHELAREGKCITLSKFLEDTAISLPTLTLKEGYIEVLEN